MAEFLSMLQLNEWNSSMTGNATTPPEIQRQTSAGFRPTCQHIDLCGTAIHQDKLFSKKTWNVRKAFDPNHISPWIRLERHFKSQPYPGHHDCHFIQIRPSRKQCRHKELQA